METTRRSFQFTIVLLLAAFAVDQAEAASHLWRVNEVFSNLSGTIQFIELHECCGASGENFIGGHNMFCDVSQNNFVFPGHLSGDTSFKYLLLATAGFAALPGAPTPDYIIEDNFFEIDGDTIRYSTSANYDFFTFGSGHLPTDGVQSIQLTSFSPDQFITAANSPTNYDGDSGMVDATPVPTVSQWGMVVLALALVTAGSVVMMQRTRAAATLRAG